MPRSKRIIIPGVPHHITQRGSRRQNVFFVEADYDVYLALLVFYARKNGVEIVAYCLMTNHVHLLLVASDEDSIRATLQVTHKRYSEYINTRQGWNGHLWQERFYSCPVDPDYFWVALRYIERNPVKAEMVPHASLYPWSSSVAHCGIREDTVLTNAKKWRELIASRENWYEWLGEDESREQILHLKKATSRDMPCGSESFLDQIELEYNVCVRPPKMGRPKKVVMS